MRSCAALSDAMARHDLPRILLPWRDGFVTIVPAERASALQTAASDRALQAALRHAEDGGPVLLRVGMGRAEGAAADLPRSLKTAEQALQAAHQLRIARPVMFEELGVFRLLLSPNEPLDHREFVLQVLGAVYAVDAKSRRAVLVTTLEALIRHDYNLADTARNLGLHLNTVKYRIRNLTELLGGDPTRGERRLEIELALKIAQLQRGGQCEPSSTAARPLPRRADR